MTGAGVAPAVRVRLAARRDADVCRAEAVWAGPGAVGATRVTTNVLHELIDSANERVLRAVPYRARGRMFFVAERDAHEGRLVGYTLPAEPPDVRAQQADGDANARACDPRQRTVFRGTLL